MGERLRHFLRGSVELVPPIPGPSYAKVFSEITSTRLVNTSAEPFPDLWSNLLQSFHADEILSVLRTTPAGGVKCVCSCPSEQIAVDYHILAVQVMGHLCS